SQSRSKCQLFFPDQSKKFPWTRNSAGTAEDGPGRLTCSAPVHGRIGTVLLHTLIPGADQLASHGELLHPVGTPAGDTGHGEQGRIQLLGQAQHLIDKSAVKVDVGGEHRLVLPFHQQLLADLLHIGVQGQLVLPALFRRQVIHVGPEHLAPGVGLGIDRVAQAVDQAAAVEGILVQDPGEIVRH
ncbi:MFS transporter, partial [Dysosmobacter welbionis]